MAAENGILMVEALYSFKGKNNDELCFNKGDIITVTQREEGGWWEGTLSDKTGWFPSNYTKEYKPPDGAPASPQRGDSDLLSPQHSQQQQIYRSLVLKDIIESERNHVADLQSLLGTHLLALRKADVLSDTEYKQLTGNLEEVSNVHSNLVTCLEEQSERPSRDQRIGGAFLTLAPQLQNAHKCYCTNHPRAVCMLEKYKDELNSFMECQVGVTKPGIMVLTTALSKPFRRLDKYAGMLQEYERHLDEGHPDRGDTQRSVHVYKELASMCGSIRRQKELELEVVTGRVHGWDGGETLGTLGEIMRMGSVALLPDHRDRYLVLFPTTLVMLSVSPRMSAFIFEGSYLLNNIHVSKLDDGDHYKNAFEVSGQMTERIIALCQTREDQLQWVEILSQQSRMVRTSNFPPHKPSLTSPPVPPAHVSVWSGNLGDSNPSSQSRQSVCMSCGLPLFSSCECSVDVRSDVGDGNNDDRGCSDVDRGCSHMQMVCQCHAGYLHRNDSNSSYSMPHSFPMLPPSETFYVSRPYAILTKYFSYMYKRKIITKALLRHLAGDKENEDVTNLVKLRRHRTECSIHTGPESSDDSDERTNTLKANEMCSSSGTSDTSESSSDDGYWVSDKLNIFSPIPSRKPLTKIESRTLGRTSSNLQKWRYQHNAVNKCLNSSVSSSGESGVSTDGSNPYGYVRYYNPEDSNLGSPRAENRNLYEEETRNFTSIKPAISTQNIFVSNFIGDKSSSCGDPYYSSSHNIIPSVSSVTLTEDAENDFCCTIAAVENEERHSWWSSSVRGNPTIYPTMEGVSSDISRNPKYSENLSLSPFFGTNLSSSLSMPSISYYSSQKGDTSSKTGTVHSSYLDIPAVPIVLPSVLPSESDDFSDSTPNVCDRTIYEASYSSDDAGVGKPDFESDCRKPYYPFKSKPDVAYYVSSCSGDETGNDRCDYYESHRKQVPMATPLSHSEPNLCQNGHSKDNSRKLKQFSSHYVQLVHNVENPAKVCSCENHSHRSSDSGLADVTHHLECCPLRGETPGLGRGSSVSRFSHSSQFSTVKSSRSISSCQGLPCTPDCGAEEDSLILTPVATPCTSAPVSYAADSLTSLLDSVALHHSTSAHELNCTRFSEVCQDESVYRSGLYAHWWMKASVCPKTIALDKTKRDYLRFRVDKKPDVPPKPKFLKPSYHIRRGGIKGAVTKPNARSAATQTNFKQGHQQVKVNILPLFSPSCLRDDTLTSNEADQVCGDGSVRPKLKQISAHLSPQSSVTISRDRSFESQASQVSQVTVIPRLSSSQRGATSSESQEHQLHIPSSRGKYNKMKMKFKALQGSSENSTSSELASLHSFSESCERDGNPPHVRDSSEGLDVDFCRRASSHSLHANVEPCDSFTSTLYCHLQPVPSSSAQSTRSAIAQTSSSVLSSVGISEAADGKDGNGKPSLPPKPLRLQLRPVQRSKSLPKLPMSTFSVHKQSKDLSS